MALWGLQARANSQRDQTVTQTEHQPLSGVTVCLGGHLVKPSSVTPSISPGTGWAPWKPQRRGRGLLVTCFLVACHRHGQGWQWGLRKVARMKREESLQSWPWGAGGDGTRLWVTMQGGICYSVVQRCHSFIHQSFNECLLSTGCWWLILVILAIWETEIRRTGFEASPGKLLVRTPSPK
jgi:hypothetical protein